MLKSVLDEMDSERAFPEAAPRPMPQAEPQEYRAAVPPLPRAGLDPQLVEDMLAERDAQIAELQQAVVELANQQDQVVASAMQPEMQALQEKIARLEAKTFEQERTIRHTLTMLIEWIEGEMDESKAA
jgi:general secretion pathway protein A